MMVPQLQSVLIFVHDLDRAVFFYCGTLGFPLRSRWVGGAEVGANGATLTLALADDDNLALLTGRSTGMTFAVDRGTYEALASRDVFAAAPTHYPWGSFAIVTDPDGNEFAVTAPVEEAVEDVDADAPRLLTRHLRLVESHADAELSV